jgi:hypothetical protein
MTSRTIIVVLVAPTPKSRHTNRLGARTYQGDNLDTPRIIDLACVQCVAGRIKDRGMWMLFDRAGVARLLESPDDIVADVEE